MNNVNLEVVHKKKELLSCYRANTDWETRWKRIHQLQSCVESIVMQLEWNLGETKKRAWHGTRRRDSTVENNAN